jgi:fatty acid desaturase
MPWAAILLGVSFPVFTRVHLGHHAHVKDPKHDTVHIVSTFGALWWLIAAQFIDHEVMNDGKPESSSIRIRFVHMVPAKLLF